MSDIAATSSFVRQELVPERPAPVKTTGFIGFLRTRLFNSPTNILLTIVSILVLWLTVIPAVKFLLVDAVWRGADRMASILRQTRVAVRPVPDRVDEKEFDGRNHREPQEENAQDRKHDVGRRIEQAGAKESDHARGLDRRGTLGDEFLADEGGSSRPGHAPKLRLIRHP